ncbi:lytic transglycosylase domain-containing protein [Rhizobium sp. TRM95111]|uniref:lytic transglycosylase domain-containing protein n=1 Tax=Rhizobium alarense TaxID=2846851 RepID=UPI001F2B5C40|nr:lytic transglycosylase domain-containing protein [Rhizobium alarense]MCF3641661.1 lytic transglycosylase domain-containing protein [Rhizobium alarense]
MTARRSIAFLALLSAGALALTWTAAPVEAENAPLPRAKPLGFAAEMPSRDVTGAILRADRVAPVSGALKDGLDALSDSDGIAALRIRNAMAEGSLDRHILTWAIALSGERDIPSSEIAAAQRELKGWPGLAALRAHSERALARENPPARDVLSAFGTTRPETAEGAVVLARALVEAGEPAAAAKTIRSYWLTETMSVALEDRMLDAFGTLLTAADHLARMKMLLYRERAAQAERFSTLGKAQSLYKAWAAVIRKAANAGALLKAVAPSWHRDPAYLFLRIEMANRADRYREAAKLLADSPKDRAALVDPAAWWVEARIASRGLAEQGDYRDAYRIAAGHAAVEETDVVEAEFHAGWYALRGLKDAATAERHFRRILQVSSRPLAQSRAWYWLGRAAEAGAAGAANDHFTKAAVFSGTYYGQLAAARLGRKTLNVAYPAPSADDRTRFAEREPVKAIARLDAAGHGWRAASIYRALAEDLTSPGELAMLSAQAEKTVGHQLSLQIGKIAFARGIDVAALAFPIGVIPDSADIDGSGKALAYAIARQESAFNPAAISPANARGLLQLLPGTAQGVAKRYGLSYSKDRLTSDAAYNATLGAHYLGEQIADFGGSYILTFIAYNAGPRRVGQWIERYGDPRGRPIDEVVDWVEKIPFSETRHYVQRVMENYQVYKTRLGETADIVHDLRMGR